MPKVSPIVLFASIMLSACASSSTSYTPPQPVQVNTERVVRMPFDIAWDRYVEALSSSFFVINNISKDSRIINISFSSSHPNEFVNCGLTQRESYHPADGKRRFEYATADTATYTAGQKGTNIIWTVTRDARLEGRANVFMAPRNEETVLRVNAKYIWSVNTRGYSNIGSSASPESRTVDFSTTSSGSTPQGDAPLTCTSRGVLEQRLLDLI